MVRPRTNHAAIVGMAFDYMLRFELKRRVPTAQEDRWTAEGAGWVTSERENGTRLTWGPLFAVGQSLRLKDPVLSDNYDASLDAVNRTTQVFRDGQDFVNVYRNRAAPNDLEKRQLAFHAVRLAKLEVLARVGQLDPTFETADDQDIADLMRLLEIVPWNALMQQPLLLNPGFEGGDADLIAGDLLIDVKTTKASRIDARWIDQLIGYLILVRHGQRTLDLPVVNQLGIYLSRHGCIWRFDVSNVTNHPEFAGVEQWFLEYTQVPAV